MTQVSGRSRQRSTLLALGLLLVAAGLYTWGAWRYFTLVVPGGNDFMAHYTAWEAFLKEGLNPYSDEAALYTQQAIRGRPALPGEDQNRLTYPFYSIVVHAPFILLDYAVARALYMTLLQGALVAGVALCLRLLRWRPAPWLLVGVLAWSLLHYPEARGIILGQFAIFGFAALVGTLYLLSRGHDAAAGALLVLTTIKLPLVFLVIPFLLAWALAQRRWRFLAGFGGVLAAAVVGSLLVLPTWMGDWLFRVRDYSSYTAGQSPLWLLAHQALPWLGSWGEWLLIGGLLLSMGWSWRRALPVNDVRQGEWQWALGLTLVVSNLIVPRSATTNYAILLPPTLWVFAALDRRMRHGRWLLLGLLALTLVGNWWLHLSTVVGNQEQPILFIPWPVGLLLVLVLARRWLLDDARQAAGSFVPQSLVSVSASEAPA